MLTPAGVRRILRSAALSHPSEVAVRPSAAGPSRQPSLLFAMGVMSLAALAVMGMVVLADTAEMDDEEDAFIAKLMEMDAKKMASVQLPPATLRPAGFAVFGEDF